MSLPFGRKLAAVLLLVLVHVGLGAAMEDQQWYQTLSDDEESKLRSLESSLLRARGDPIRIDVHSLRPKKSFPTAAQDDVCSRYLDHFAPEYKCISTGTDFVMQLLDDKVASVLLCNNFVYTPTTTINLSELTKTVICQEGNCVIDGSQFNPNEESAFITSGFASLFFCGIDFVNFFDMVSFYDSFIFDHLCAAALVQIKHVCLTHTKFNIFASSSSIFFSKLASSPWMASRSM